MQKDVFSGLWSHISVSVTLFGEVPDLTDFSRKTGRLCSVAGRMRSTQLDELDNEAPESRHKTIVKSQRVVDCQHAHPHQVSEAVYMWPMHVCRQMSRGFGIRPTFQSNRWTPAAEFWHSLKRHIGIGQLWVLVQL